ncbi:MAG TPA: hypothetical protein VI583_15360 [Cyclobacteriaceae bacterium]|nr:hypothetical protein [Cyclobacteriaceae bacterium]
MGLFKKFRIFLISAFILISCKDHGKLSIAGDPEAIQLAQSMMEALGGREEWSKFKSIYIRSVNSTTREGSFILEEWIELEIPRAMNRQVINGEPVIRILDGNDGWIIRQNKVDLLSSSAVTSLLDWHKHYMLRALQGVAAGGERRELKMNGKTGFAFYENGSFIGSFELGDENLPLKYSASPEPEDARSIRITRWGDYMGLKYPLEINDESGISIYKTDYWDPRDVDAVKAFNISFNPAEIIESNN